MLLALGTACATLPIPRGDPAVLVDLDDPHDLHEERFPQSASLVSGHCHLTSEVANLRLLERASVAEVKAAKISKDDGYLVVAMRLYPRFLPKSLTNEYTKSLTPEAALFGLYRELKKRSGQQNLAFQSAGYEQNFALSQEGMIDLARLASLSTSQSVFLVCQCDRQEYCHVDLLLLIAESRFGARIGKLPYDYPEFRTRLRNGL